MTEPKEEIWKDFECLRCGGVFKIEITVPYIGWKCKHCNFYHMFKKGQKELECDTIKEIQS